MKKKTHPYIYMKIFCTFCTLLAVNSIIMRTFRVQKWVKRLHPFCTPFAPYTKPKFCDLSRCLYDKPPKDGSVNSLSTCPELVDIPHSVKLTVSGQSKTYSLTDRLQTGNLSINWMQTVKRIFF